MNFPEGVAVDDAGNLFIATDGRIRKVSAANATITTVAGAGTVDGDGAPATTVSLAFPSAVAVDRVGNFFIADQNHHRIRKVSPSGLITTVAGNGSAGFSGDNGPATGAALNFPSGVAIDNEGTLYIADLGNARIRKVTVASGMISTIAGNGMPGFSGDGGPATAAQLHSACSVAVDAFQNVYIADSFNQRIRKITKDNGAITTVAGSGTPRASGDGGFSGDGGAATLAELDRPKGVVVSVSGDLYVADTGNGRVRKIILETSQISTVAGNGSSGARGDGELAVTAELETIFDAAFDASGNLYLASTSDQRIRKITAGTGVITTVAGNGLFGGGGNEGDGGSATAAALTSPIGVVLDSSGNLYFSDDQRIRRVSASSGLITTFAGKGVRGFSGDGGQATAAALLNPFGLAIDAQSNLYIADVGNGRIRKVSAATGIITTVAGNGAEGNVADGVVATASRLLQPVSVAVDSRGNLFIVDKESNQVRKVDPVTGIIGTVAGNGTQQFAGDGGPATAASLNVPLDVALDSAGNLYVADSGNNRIRKVAAASGVITTMAGRSATGRFSGDGGPAIAAELNFPAGIAIDPRDEGLFIVDQRNNRIRAVFACKTVAPPALTSPSDGALGVPLSAKLSWGKVSGAFSYDIYLDQNNPPEELIASNVESTSYAATNLEPNATYFWKVVANGDRFCPAKSTAPSAVRLFQTLQSCGPAAVR